MDESVKKTGLSAQLKGGLALKLACGLFPVQTPELSVSTMVHPSDVTAASIMV